MLFPVKLHQDSIQTVFNQHVLPLCCPHWQAGRVNYDFLKDGYTNLLVAVSRDHNTNPEFLLRINGNNTELYIDREYEVAVMQSLHKSGIGPPLYCQFNNGLCYGFLPGRMLDLAEISNPIVGRKIAAIVASLHSLPPPPACGRVTGQARILQSLTDWMSWLSSPKVKITERFTRLYGSMEYLKRETEVMKEEIAKFTSPLVLCHNDLQCRNMIYNEMDGSIKLIDFEYAGVNHIAFDIGNFFNEFAGLDDVDFSRYPSESFQKWWIRAYLEESAKLKGTSVSLITDDQVDVLYREANKSALASNLKWALWSVLQQQFSSIDIDYLEYGAIRLNEYKAKKDKFLLL